MQGTGVYNTNFLISDETTLNKGDVSMAKHDMPVVN